MGDVRDRPVEETSGRPGPDQIEDVHNGRARALVRREETSPTDRELLLYILDCRTGSAGTRSPTPPALSLSPFRMTPCGSEPRSNRTLSALGSSFCCSTGRGRTQAARSTIPA